ncbi:MAG: N-acetylmuramoyl-L-alanine amidase [Actinomycetales bacterium]
MSGASTGPQRRSVRRVAGVIAALSCLALAGCGASGTHSAADSAALSADRATASASATSAAATVTPVAPKALAAPTTGPRPAAASKAVTSPKPLSGNGSLAGKVIVIDPGHNGGNFTHPSEINRLVDAGFGQRKACNTTGTSTNAGYTEAAYTFDVAKRLAAVLRARGAKVVMTRATNTGVGPCINERAAIGNAAHADAVLSIHGDGSTASGARGFHVIIAQRMMGGSAVQRSSQRLGDDIRSAFRSGAGMPYSTYTGGGTAETHRTDIGGLNLSTRPAVMVETGNMRSATDARLMSSASWRQRAAAALAAGLARYLT